jgi:hypothetical protein
MGVGDTFLIPQKTRSSICQPYIFYQKSHGEIGRVTKVGKSCPLSPSPTGGIFVGFYFPLSVQFRLAWT